VTSTILTAALASAASLGGAHSVRSLSEHQPASGFRRYTRTEPLVLSSAYDLGVSATATLTPRASSLTNGVVRSTPRRTVAPFLPITMYHWSRASAPPASTAAAAAAGAAAAASAPGGGTASAGKRSATPTSPQIT